MAGECTAGAFLLSPCAAAVRAAARPNPPALGAFAEGTRAPIGPTPLCRYSQQEKAVRGKEEPTFYPVRKREKKSGGYVTVFFEMTGKLYPLRGYKPKKRRRKNEIDQNRKSETGGAPAGAKRRWRRWRKEADRRHRKAGKERKSRRCCPARCRVVQHHGDLPTAGKTVRRVQQLTQEGVLETGSRPAAGARKYRTCATVQRYVAYVEAKAQETGETAGRRS